MSSFQLHPEFAANYLYPVLAAAEPNWYAIQTKPRNEKWVAGQLKEKGVFTFLPVLRQLHQWSDRRTNVEVPMFSCYVFVRISQTAEERLKVLRTPGVFGFVGNERQGTAIPDDQVESLRTALREKIPCALHPFVKVGNRVRIRGGSLDGVVGILEGEGAEQSVIVSVELLRRSISIRVEGYDLELA